MESVPAEPKDHAAEEAAALDYLVEPPEEREQHGGVQPEGQSAPEEGHMPAEGRKDTEEVANPQGADAGGSAQSGAQSSQAPPQQQSGEVHAIIPQRSSKRPRAPADREEEQSKRVRFKERKEEPGRSKTRRMDLSPLPLRLLVRSAVYEDITVVVARDATINQLKRAIEEQSNGRLRDAFSPMLLLGKMPLMDNLLTLKQVGIVQDDTVIGFLPKDTRAFIQSAGLRPLHQAQEKAPLASPMPRPSPTGEAAARALVGLGNLTAEGYIDALPSPPVARPQSSQKKGGSANPGKQRTSILESFTLSSSSLLGPRLDPSQLPPGYYQVSPAELLMKGMSAASRRPASSTVKRRSSPVSTPLPPQSPKLPLPVVTPQATIPTAEPEYHPPTTEPESQPPTTEPEYPPPTTEPELHPPPEPEVAASPSLEALPSPASTPQPDVSSPLASFPTVSGGFQTPEKTPLEYLPSYTPPMSTAFPQTVPPPQPNVQNEDNDWEARARAAAMRDSNAPANQPFGGGEMQVERPPDSVLGRDDGDWDKVAQQMALRSNQWLRMEGDARYVTMRPFEAVGALPTPPQNEAFGSPPEAVPLPQATPGPSSQENTPPDGTYLTPNLAPPPSENGFGIPESEGTPLQEGQQWQLALCDSKGLRQKHPAGEQRRARRLFTVGEVEALVTAVERLGTGRWREVKQRAFPLAKHRTYADLKDKWKTLVRTAQIAPSQRRGVEVPEELLERVTRAHAFWRRQAQFDERYYAEYGVSMQGLPYSQAMQDGGTYGLHPYPGQDPPPPLMEEIRDPQDPGEHQPSEHQHAQVRSPQAGQTHSLEEFADAEEYRQREEDNCAPQMAGSAQLASHGSEEMQEGARDPVYANEQGYGGADLQGGQLRGELVFRSVERGAPHGTVQARGGGRAMRDFSSSRPLANAYVASSGVESIRAAYERQVSSEAPLDGYRRGPPALYQDQTFSEKYAEVAPIEQQIRTHPGNFDLVNGVEATEASNVLDPSRVQEEGTYEEPAYKEQEDAQKHPQVSEGQLVGAG